MIWLILSLTLILRLINLNQSLWWDEAINIVYAKSTGFWWFVTKYPIGDFHPPGYFAILWVWGHLFGFSEVSARLPSVILGVLTVLLTFLIGKKIFSNNVGLLGALFLSLAPLHIYYSQEARMYSFAAFATTFASYFLLKFVRSEKFAFLGYALSVCLVLYSDYLAYFIIPFHILFIALYFRRFIKKYFFSVILGTLPFLLWLPILSGQLQNGIETSKLVSGWRSVVGGVGAKEIVLLPVKILLGRITFENKLFYAFLLFLIAIPFGLAFKKALNYLEEKVNFLLLWIFIPAVLAFAISFFIPIFSYFRFIFILPAVYLLIALGLDKYKKNIKYGLIALILIFEVIASGIYILNPKFQREDWKGVVEFINQNSTSRTLTLFKSNDLLAPFTYYQSKSVQSLKAFKKIPVVSSDEINDLNQLTKGSNRIFILNYLVDITDPQRILEKEIEKLGYRKEKEYDFRGVGLIELYVK